VKDIQHVSGTAVAVEMLITAVLVLVVFAAAADANNTPSVKGSAPLAIGTSTLNIYLILVIFHLKNKSVNFEYVSYSKLTLNLGAKGSNLAISWIVTF
jgi:glycerol uptake facilitator-like aquaporin